MKALFSPGSASSRVPLAEVNHSRPCDQRLSSLSLSDIFVAQDFSLSTAMDRSPTPAPSLISSLEAMIQASVAAALQHQLAPVNKPLNTQMEEAVTAVLDRQLDPLRDSLNAQIEATVDAALDRRLSTMSGTLDTRFRPLVDAARERRLGPVGSPLNALITLNVPQPVSTTLTKNHDLVVPQTALAVPLTTDRMQAVVTT